MVNKPLTCQHFNTINTGMMINEGTVEMETGTLLYSPQKGGSDPPFVCLLINFEFYMLFFLKKARPFLSRVSSPSSASSSNLYADTLHAKGKGKLKNFDFPTASKNHYPAGY